MSEAGLPGLEIYSHADDGGLPLDRLVEAAKAALP